MQNHDAQHDPKSPVNMPVQMIYDLAEKARADEAFWTAFKHEKDREGEPRVKLVLVKDFLNEHLGEKHGYDITTLLLMLRGYALTELGQEEVFTPTEAQIHEAVALLRSNKEYFEYALEYRGKFRDNHGRIAGDIISETRKKTLKELFKTEDMIFSPVITQEINRKITEERARRGLAER